MYNLSAELADMAARHIAEEGLSYAQAKRKAAKQAGVGEHSASMPDNVVIEAALRSYLSEHYGDSQPALLAQLRQTALKWMVLIEGLSAEEVHARCLATGAIVNGTATQWSAVHLQICTDDSKFLEMALLNRGFDIDATEQSIAGQMRPVMVVHDDGLPIVLTILPASDYRPKLASSHSVQQVANIAKLQALCTEVI